MKKLRSDTLKIIAMLLMVVDHAGILIVQKYSLITTDYEAFTRVNYIYEVCRGVGRIAFPIFAYQIAVGMMFTKNRIKHLVMLLVFALISEIPYDMCFSGKVLEFSDQNVIFTLFLGALAIYASDLLIEKMGLEGKTFKAAILLKFIILAAVVTIFSVIAKISNTDYNAKGVILIAIFYVLLHDRIMLGVLGPILFIIDFFVISLINYKSMSSTMSYLSNEIYAVLAFPLILADSYERRGGKIIKWVGYIFYPVHIVILYFIGEMIVK